jgi:hypothetical protein
VTLGHNDQLQVWASDDMPTSSIFHIDAPQAKFYFANIQTNQGHIHIYCTSRITFFRRGLVLLAFVYNMTLEQHRNWGRNCCRRLMGNPYPSG